MMNLSNLRQIFIGQNTFRGTLPEWIGTAWPSLTDFDVSENSFEGTLPDSIRQWSSIKEFDINGNQFRGNLTDSMASWSQLTVCRQKLACLQSVPHRCLVVIANFYFCFLIFLGSFLMFGTMTLLVLFLRPLACGGVNLSMLISMIIDLQVLSPYLLDSGQILNAFS